LAQSLADLLADRAGWDDRRAVARHYVEEQRNWFSNIRHYEPVYQRLLSGQGYSAHPVQDSQRTSQVKTV
jgi:hypothetical protein